MFLEVLKKRTRRTKIWACPGKEIQYDFVAVRECFTFIRCRTDGRC